VDIDRIMSSLNAPVGWLLRSPLHPLLSFGLLLITVTGWRSGRRYTIPVGYQRQGDSIRVLVSKPHRKQWWRNFCAPAAVEVRIRGRDRRGRARVVPDDTPEFQEAIAETLRRLPFLGRLFAAGVVLVVIELESA
jgi:deazaflavin-dependent oxidoreductase (nitroreductase family)